MVNVSFAGALYIFLLTTTAIVGCTVYTPIATLVLLVAKVRPLPPIAYNFVHSWNNIIQGLWFHFCSILLEILFDVRVSHTLISDAKEKLEDVLRAPSRNGKYNILISNHRTRIDWMLMWMLLARTDMLFTLKIVLKGALAYIPFFGWTMQTFRFIFLSRKWEDDKHHIANVFSYMRRHDERATFFIFPEGSDLSESNIKKSNEYAEKNGLRKYRYILNPRTTGAVAMKNLLGVHNIERIYDITMGYSDHIRTGRANESSLLSGQMPYCVHFLCASYQFGDRPRDVPSDDDGFKKWIEARFEEKEVLLSNFYQSSPVGFEKKSITAVYGSKIVMSQDTACAGGAIMASRRTVQQRCSDVFSRNISLCCLIFAFWILPTCYFFFQMCIKWSSGLWLWFIATSIGYIVVGRLRGGLDKWLMFG